jgi:murein L,D-transpeptidase YcbB/YkuD
MEKLDVYDRGGTLPPGIEAWGHMKKIFSGVVIICLLSVAGCEGGDSRSSAPSGSPAPPAGQNPQTATPPKEVPKPPLSWSARDEAVLKAAIDARAQHGLEHVNFWPKLDGKPPEERSALLTKAALRYAGALARGAVNPVALYKVYELKRPDLDMEAGLRQAIEQKDLAGWLQGLAPQDPAYGVLSKAYLAESQAKGGGHEIADGDLLRPGAEDERAPEVRNALADTGYLPADAAKSQEAVYDGDMVKAVKALQSDYGLNPDGIIGPATLAMLNAGPEDRARTLAVAMERLRWLAREAAPDRIDVNTAAAELAYVRGGQVVDRRKVITGKPGKETPQLEAPLYRLVSYPTWTVPRSIEGEITAKGEGYMANNGLYWRKGRIIQRSGPQNSLGLVKFDLRNDHAIYLHDTPSKSLFGRQQRQLSHGCVRVNEAEAFADRIAGDEGIETQWAEAKEKHKEAFVPLPREIAVRLMYRTAVVTDAGTVRYVTDPYGWDEAVAEKLGFAAVSASKFHTTVNDTGP